MSEVFTTGFPWKTQQVTKLSESQNPDLKSGEEIPMANLSSHLSCQFGLP